MGRAAYDACVSPRPPTRPDPLETPDHEDTVRISLGERSRGDSARVATLRVVAGPGRDMLNFWTLGPGEALVIGRDETQASVVLSDSTVSKRHAEILVGEHGVVVSDLQSTNGTSINGDRCMGPRALLPGDDLEIGGVLLRLELLSEAELRHLGRVARRLSEAGSDPLTRLRTRRYLDEELPELVARSQASGQPLSCTFLDLDRFKSINDNWGHRVGDEVLVLTARIVLASVRDEDACIRYGGEEILVVYPNTDINAAAVAADRLRRAIAAHDWHRTAPDLMVTASFGVAERRKGERIEHWVHRADRALYAAKAQGRNCVRRSD